MRLNRLRVLLRAERDITQLELATRLGWKTGRLWNLENGYREATADERAALTRFFNVTEDAIWGASSNDGVSHAGAVGKISSDDDL